MTTIGWVMMIVSMGFVIGFFVSCFYRVVTAPKSGEHLHGPPDIDTRDREPKG